MTSANFAPAGVGPDNPGMLQGMSRSPAVSAPKYRLLGSRLARRLFTRNFRCEIAALGERNTHAFSVGWITVDWLEAAFSFRLVKDSRLPFETIHSALSMART